MLESGASRHQIIDLWHHLLAACSKRSQSHSGFCTILFTSSQQVTRWGMHHIKTHCQQNQTTLIYFCDMLQSGASRHQIIDLWHHLLAACCKGSQSHSVFCTSSQQVTRWGMHHMPLSKPIVSKIRPGWSFATIWNQAASSIKSLISGTTCLQRVAKGHKVVTLFFAPYCSVRVTRWGMHHMPLSKPIASNQTRLELGGAKH